jgi:PAS domain S-box-containing protein
LPIEKLQADLIAARNALRESDARFTTLADALPHMVWSALPDGFHDYFNARWYEFTGVVPGSTDGEEWNAVFHPDDRERAWAVWRHSLGTGEPYEIEYRLRHRSGDYRWTIGRAMPVCGPDGEIVRWIGTCTDIDLAKRQAERVEILSRELSHRIKNIFAVIGGLIGLSARHDPAHKPFAKRLQQRIAALGRAHELAQPRSELPGAAGVELTLHALLGEILAPYPAREEGRVSISGDDLLVDDRCATPLAMLTHELATNAAKYGALSSEKGRVALRTVISGQDLLLEWQEEGGPKVAAPGTSGFGTLLAKLSIEDQLGGSIDREWLSEGLRVTVTVPASRVRRF